MTKDLLLFLLNQIEVISHDMDREASNQREKNQIEKAELLEGFNHDIKRKLKEVNEAQKKTIIFWGCKLNNEEIKNHRLSYKTLASQFEAVLCNNICEVDPNLFDNLESGDFYSYYIAGEEVSENDFNERKEQIEDAIVELNFEEWETEEQKIIIDEHIKQLEDQLADFETLKNEVFQWFIVSNSALWYLKRAGELVFYSDILDCYIWGVCHWGASWDYVMTSLRISDDFSRLED